MILSKAVRTFGNASFSKDGTFRVDVIWRVEVDDKLDGPDTIRRDPDFRFGASYAAGNDANANMLIVNVQPKRLGNTLVWDVTVTYEASATPPSDSSPPPGGGGEENPDRPQGTYAPRFSTRPFFYRVPVTRAKFFGVYMQERGDRNKVSDKLGGRWDEYVGQVLNSALKPVNPQPEVDQAGTMIRQSGYWSAGAAMAAIEGLLPLQGKVNSAEMILRNPAGNVVITCAPYTLKLEAAIMDEAFGNEGLLPASVEWAWKPSGWFEDVPDVGNSIKAGEPAEISMGGNAVAAMHQDEFAIVDSRGEIMTEESALNGFGALNTAIDAYQFFNRFLFEQTAEFPTLGTPYTGAWG